MWRKWSECHPLFLPNDKCCLPCCVIHRGLAIRYFPWRGKKSYQVSYYQSSTFLPFVASTNSSFVCFKGRSGYRGLPRFPCCLMNQIRVCRVPQKVMSSLHTAEVYWKPRPTNSFYLILYLFTGSESNCCQTYLLRSIFSTLPTSRVYCGQEDLQF